jgi:hypothetical protein
MVVIASGVLWPGAPGNPQLSHRCAVSALPGPLRHNAGMSHTPTPLLIFAGSTRAQSHNRRLAQVAAGMASAQGAQVTHIELADFELPLYNADLEARGTPPSASRSSSTPPRPG